MSAGGCRAHAGAKLTQPCFLLCALVGWSMLLVPRFRLMDWWMSACWLLPCTRRSEASLWLAFEHAEHDLYEMIKFHRDHRENMRANPTGGLGYALAALPSRVSRHQPTLRLAAHGLMPMVLACMQG
jgi:hypothetical protein